jgi:hypothetical protein
MNSSDLKCYTKCMEKIKAIVQRKPLLLLLISVGYLVLTGILKWNIHPNFGSVTFIAGGLLGIYFLDIAEVFFLLQPSPFRSVVFVAGLTIVSLFVITSSGSMLASGLVLSLFLTLLLWQIGEWELHKNLSDWYRMISGAVSLRTQQLILWATALIFIVETFLFVL